MPNSQKETNIAHVVYATDDKFAEILGVSLVSLFENSMDMEEIVVYILESGISDKNKKRIYEVCENYNRHRPIFIQAKNISKELKMDVNIDRGSFSQYARLFISSDLPEYIERVLYMDCDIIVNKSIKELWNLDMDGCTIAALKDAFSKEYRRNIDLEKNDVMFNSGVMLIDLKKWKMANVEGKLLKFIEKKGGKIQQGDQGALNSVLSKSTYCFEPRFNSVTIFYDFAYEEMLTYRKPVSFYTKKEVELAVEQPNIIHYTTSIFSKRPWIKGCNHRYANRWLEYKEKSPWRNEPLWEDNSSLWKKNLMKIVNKLPRKIAILIAGIMQAYVRPLINTIKYRR